jgi:hypothetical protein
MCFGGLLSKIITGQIYDPTTTFAEKGKDGLIRYYDMVSGDVVAVLGNNSEVSRLPVELIEVTREDGSKVTVQKNIALDEKTLGIRGAKMTPLLVDVLCSRVAGGESLKKISEEADMPSYAMISKWAAEDEKFAEKLERARASRAEYYAEKAVEVAEDAMPTLAGVAKAKLHVDTLWKAAEADKPQRFSPKLKVTGEIKHAHSLVVDTGIRRVGDAGYNADETAKLRMKLERQVEEIKVSQIETAREDVGDKTSGKE